MATITRFDFNGLRRAIEERDASKQLGFYADDAEVHLVDRDHPPGAARILRGGGEIRAWLEDVCARDMTHRVSNELVDDGRAAYTVSCRYPDGTKVLCAAMVDLADGRIVHQLGIQVWDE